MADTSPDSVIVKTIGPFIATAIGTLIGWMTDGSTGGIGSVLTALLAVVGGISGLAFSVIYKRYLGVLAAGGRRKGSPAREAYDNLRESLAGGNLAARLYADWLRAFLDAVDRFFGDAGKADGTLFPHAFGLRTPAPLWTAPAFDRCLLLALFYPIATIFIIWAMSGHVGLAEAAFGLNADLSAWRRGLVVAMIALSSFAAWRARRTEGMKSVFWFAVAVAGVGAATLVGAVAGAVAFAFAFAGAFAGAVAGAGAVAVAVAGAFAGADVGAGVIAGAVALFNDVAIKNRGQGIFLLLFLVGMILICLWAADVLSAQKSWAVVGPLLLFVGLFTLINAPFYWTSLGLSRALLRRGLELGGWWPYFLAVVDAILAADIVTFLAITMVLGVQAFDYLAIHGGGAPIRSSNSSMALQRISLRRIIGGSTRS